MLREEPEGPILPSGLACIHRDFSATREVTMDVYLDTKETDLLMGVLEYRLEDLRREIHHTDSRTFKAELKADEAIMQGILTKLRTPAAMGI